MQAPDEMPRCPRPIGLFGRRDQCAALSRLISAVRAGESRALVVHGEPGVGKTALLDYLAEQALGCRVVRGSGVESEMELPYAGLYQLCAPLLGRLDRLPDPQRAALQTAFALNAGPTPDRFQVGLAVLSLLSEAAEDRPMICVVDDHQWLDTASAQALAFVARRLGTEAVGLVLATRVVGTDLRSLPELPVQGLSAAAAGALLDAILSVPVDSRVRNQIVAETGGNPLALIELPRGLTPTELAGGFGLPGAMPLGGSIEGNFARRAGTLPELSRQLLLVAASEPSGDPALMWRAAERLGIPADAITPAVEQGLIELGVRVRFRHPLARSAVYRSASAEARRQAHGALAEVTDPDHDPDQRAWHQAQAVTAPHEHVAAALELSATRAQARGGFAAAAGFLRQATTLTPDSGRRTARALAAVKVHLVAGTLDPVPDLLSVAEAGPLTEPQRAQADLMRAQLAFVTNRGSGPPLLLKAARRLAPIDVVQSRETYLEAMAAAIFVGRLAGPEGDLAAVARAAAHAPPSPEVLAPDLFLDAMVAVHTDGYEAGLPLFRRGLAEYGAKMSPQTELRWLWFASTNAMRIWDDAYWDVLSARHVELARDLGSFSELSLALDVRALACLAFGELTEAARIVDEAQSILLAAGTALTSYGAVTLAALRGRLSAGAQLHKHAVLDADRRGEGAGSTAAEWAGTILYNGLGRYRDALVIGRRAASDDESPVTLLWPHVELVEAAVRSQDLATAEAAYDRLAGTTKAAGSDWALGLQLRSKALLARGDEAEELYLESIAHLGRTKLRVDLARAYLLYGEWLRRERRQVEARNPLRTAHKLLDSMGVPAFADRADRELRAAGGGVRKRVDASRDDDLTAQEGHIARMARDGLSNTEIAARLFLSTHTVQYHLRKVFVKLGITSRSQLEGALPGRDGH